MNFIKKYKLNTETEKTRLITVFGLPVFLYGKKSNQYKTKKFFQIFPNEKFEEKILQLCIDSVGDNFDDIYLLRVGLGESYLINYIIKDWAKKNGSKNPVFLNPQNINKTWECFSPIPIKHLTINWDALWALKNNNYKYKNHRIFVFIPLNDVHKIGRSYLKKVQPHFETLCNYIGLKNINLSPVNICFSEDTIKKCNEYLEYKNINKDNFVFISKEALSIPLLPENFWNKITKQIRMLGYDILLNSKELNISESVYIASLAKSVIAIRSGFSEGISAVAKQMFIFYTPLKYPPIPAKIFLDAYSLKNYPMVKQNNIFEYIYQLEKEYNIINEIKQKIGR